MNKLIFLFSVLFVVSCEKEEPALTPPTASDQQTVYGFNNEGERLYVIDLENGDVTSLHGPFEDLYRQLEYIASTNQIISSINGGQGLLTIDCETGLSKTITYSAYMSIERIIVGKNDIIYGYNNDDERLYVIDLENGDVTPSHDPSEDLYRELEYVTSTNQIISSINGGQGLLTIDCETGLSKKITYSTNMSIERIIVGKNDIIYGYNNDDNRLYIIDLENGDLTPSHGPFEELYWELEYITSTNQIISSINGGQGLITIDCETGLSKKITYSTNMSIERIIVGKK